jgi:hypothetical protein
MRTKGSVANAVEADLVRCIVTRKPPALFRGVGDQLHLLWIRHDRFMSQLY